MSTTLQRDFFDKHPQVMFLGWGVADMPHGWIDDETAALCEVGIRYENSLLYDAAAAQQIFARHVARFESDPGKRLLCLSSESFSFTMHFDVDPTIKAERLKRLMGDGCKVLIVIRNQLDLIASYYFECVRGGYAGHFGDFLDFHYHYLFHSILPDLRYDRTYRLYAGLFGANNIKVVPMESLVARTRTELKGLCDYAGIDDIELTLLRRNESSDKAYLQAVRLLNEKFTNNHGNGYFGWVDPEKLEAYWRVSRNLPQPAQASRNHSHRMMIYRTARAVVSDFVDHLDASYAPYWRQVLEDFYSESNSAMADLTGIDLMSLGYPGRRRDKSAQKTDQMIEQDR
jgi:hypothetical protein